MREMLSRKWIDDTSTELAALRRLVDELLAWKDSITGGVRIGKKEMEAVSETDWKKPISRRDVLMGSIAYAWDNGYLTRDEYQEISQIVHSHFSKGTA